MHTHSSIWRKHTLDDCAVLLIVFASVCGLQLGDGTRVSRQTPPSTDALTGVAAIATGYYHVCVLMTSGGVRCWGNNGVGQASET